MPEPRGFGRAAASVPALRRGQDAVKTLGDPLRLLLPSGEDEGANT